MGIKKVAKFCFLRLNGFVTDTNTQDRDLVTLLRSLTAYPFLRIMGYFWAGGYDLGISHHIFLEVLEGHGISTRDILLNQTDSISKTFPQEEAPAHPPTIS